MTSPTTPHPHIDFQTEAALDRHALIAEWFGLPDGIDVGAALLTIAGAIAELAGTLGHTNELLDERNR